VIDTIGGKTPYRKTTLERSVAGAVVASMKANGVRRVIVISSFGVGDSADQASWFVKNVVLPTWLCGSTEDKAATEAVVRASGIDFVIVRPAMLIDHAATGNVKVFQGHDTGWAQELCFSEFPLLLCRFHRVDRDAAELPRHQRSARGRYDPRKHRS